MDDRRWQAVIFDLDETLVRNQLPAAQVFREHMTGELAPVARVADSFLQSLVGKVGPVWSGMGGYPSVEASLLKIYDDILREHQLSLNPAAVMQRFTSVSAQHTVLNPGAAPLMEWLKAEQYKVGVLSNGFHCVQWPKVTAHAIEHRVDRVVVSEEVGVHKPDPAVFQFAAVKLEVEPQDCLFVGDHLRNDIEGALEAGMSACLFDPKRRHRSDSSSFFVVNHLDGVKAVLQGL